jgi:hypothetical protein
VAEVEQVAVDVGRRAEECVLAGDDHEVRGVAGLLVDADADRAGDLVLGSQLDRLRDGVGQDEVPEHLTGVEVRALALARAALELGLVPRDRRRLVEVGGEGRAGQAQDQDEGAERGAETSELHVQVPTPAVSRLRSGRESSESRRTLNRCLSRDGRSSSRQGDLRPGLGDPVRTLNGSPKVLGRSPLE